jgi:hypothetical protein
MSHKNEQCAFGYLATAERPCWGELMVNDEVVIDDGADYIQIMSCEGHLMCSMYMGISDEQNLQRYRDTKPPRQRWTNGTREPKANKR